MSTGKENIDSLISFLPMSRPEMEERQVPMPTILRVERLRSLCAYWRSFPLTASKEMVTKVIADYNVSLQTAYDDIHLVRILIGNLEATTKEFARWRLNEMLEADMASAREAEDWNAVAKMQKNWIANNQTDKEDTPDRKFDQIVPLKIEPTDDPGVLGITVPKNFRARRDKLIRQYSRDEGFTDYTEVTGEETE